jgi:hypothetical protein
VLKELFWLAVGVVMAVEDWVIDMRENMASAMHGIKEEDDGEEQYLIIHGLRVSVRASQLKPHFCLRCQIKSDNETICFVCGNHMVIWKAWMTPNAGAQRGILVSDLLSGDCEDDTKIGEQYVHPPTQVHGGEQGVLVDSDTMYGPPY